MTVHEKAKELLPDVDFVMKFMGREVFVITGNDGGGHNEGYWEDAHPEAVRICEFIKKLAEES